MGEEGKVNMKVNKHVIDKVYSKLIKINFSEKKVVQILHFVGISAQRKGQAFLLPLEF